MAIAVSCDCSIITQPEGDYHAENYESWWERQAASYRPEIHSASTNQKEAEMNGLRSRVILLTVFMIASIMHSLVMQSIPNTPEAMLVYHGSAGAVDLMLLKCAQSFISGRLCDDIQALCIASIVANFVGFLAYMAYAPPTLYDAVSLSICYVQYLRLLYVGRHDADYHQCAMVPGSAGLGSAAHN